MCLVATCGLICLKAALVIPTAAGNCLVSLERPLGVSSSAGPWNCLVSPEGALGLPTSAAFYSSSIFEAGLGMPTAARP